MNRTFLLEAALGVTFGLLLAVLVASIAKAPGAGVQRRATMLAALTYAVIIVPLVVGEGMTLAGLLLTAVVLCMPLAGAALAGRRGAGRPSGPSWLGLLVPFGLVTAVLIAAGQTLAVMGLLDPRTVVVVVALVAGIVVLVNGAAGVAKVGSWAVWLLIVPVLLAVALGFLLSSLGAALEPTAQVDGPSAGQWVAFAVALFALGWVDPALRGTAGHAASVRPWRVLVGVLLLVLLGGGGLLMFFAGSIVSPSLQFSTLVANLDIVPGPMFVMLAILTMLFVALISQILSATVTRSDGSIRVSKATVLLVLVVLLVLLAPGLERVVVVTALVAAGIAPAGAVGSRRGSLVGLAAGVVAALLLWLFDALEFGWLAAGALVAVGMVAGIASATDGSRDRNEQVVQRV